MIRNIAQLATCDPERDGGVGLITNAGLAATAGRITYVGPNVGLDAVPRASSCVEIDARHHAVVPGFVDCHTHLVWLGDRGDEYRRRARGESYEAIAASGGGIRATVAATTAGSNDELRDAVHQRARRMLLAGTTTVEIKSGYGISVAAEMLQLDAAGKLRDELDVPDVITTYLALHAAPMGDRDAVIDDVVEHGLTAAKHRARFVDIFCDDGAYSVAESERVLRAAASQGFQLKLHAEQRGHSGGAQLAARLGAVSADHLEYSDPDDAAALAAAGTVAVLLPGAALVLDGPRPPGRQLIERGCAVALATDCNPGTCYSESMPLMTSLAVSLAGLSPEQALIAATRGGAAALRLSDRGMVRAGMRCDLVLLADTGWIDVAYHLGGSVVDTVIRAGQIVGQPGG